MAEQKESSVLFSLKELMNLEEDRIRQEDEENRLGGRRQLIAERPHLQAHASSRRVRLWILAHHRGVHAGQFRSRRLQRDARRQAAQAQ